jgi:hypothetical protein
MTKPTIVTRVGKGSPLSIAEGDSNFTNLRDSTIGVLANGTTVTTDLNGSFEIEAGTGISVVGNNTSKKITISKTGSNGIASVSEDPNPILGGDLDVFTYKITSSSNRNVWISPQGTGKVKIDSLIFPKGNGTTDYVLKSDGSGNLAFASVDSLLTFTPENSANKNQANGYVGLDGSSKISSTYLPSYVDDVIEAANYAGLPGTGESGKIYVTLDTNKTYRWSGSAYIEISASPGTTDALTEGTTNFYFTQTRARAAVSASGDLSYNAATGVFSYTGISYPLQTGNSGKFLTTNGSTVSWADMTPSWYGVASSLLNMGDNTITGSANSTSGTVKFGPGSGTAAVLASNSQANLVLATDSNSISDRAKITIQPGLNGNILITPGASGTGKVSISNITFPTSTGTNGQVLTTDGNGILSFTTVSSGWTATATSDLNMGAYAIKGTSNVVKFGDASNTSNITSNGAYALKLSTDSNSGTSAFINILAGANANIGITPSGTGKVMLNGPLGLTTTSGTPTTYNTSYFEGTLDTPAAWFKVTVGASDYYLPLFQ